MRGLTAAIILVSLSIIQAKDLFDLIDDSLIPRQPRAVEEERTCNYDPDSVLESPLRIGAWNTQRLGKKKIENPQIANYIARVIARYDIIALQEITDTSQEAIYDLLLIVNEVAHLESEDNPKEYDAAVTQRYNVTLSERVGRTSYKEQYAFFYRTDVVSLRESMPYVDEHDYFTYDPFIAVFNTPTLDIDTVAIVAIHASPGQAPEEIDSLLKVYDYINQELKLNDVMLLGDFNAGCSYVKSSDWETLQLFLDERFTWLISDHVDTTTKYTTCPYDRMVITGENLTKIVYEKTAKAFHYDDELNITDLDMVTSISDHFPVEVLIKAKLRSKLVPSLSISVGPVFYSKASLGRYFDSCRNAEKLEAELIDILLNCTLPKIFTDKQNVLESLQESFGLYGNTYVNRTANDIADKKCLGKEWEKKYTDLEYSLASCGTKPYYTIMGGNIKQLGFRFATYQLLLDFLESISMKGSCLFKDEVFVILQQKLKYGVLQDPSAFMEDILEHRTLNVWCMDTYCYVSVTADVPIM